MIIRRDVWFSDYGYDYDDYLLDKYFTLTPDGKGIPITELMAEYDSAGGKKGTGVSARKAYDKALRQRSKDLGEVWDGTKAGMKDKILRKERSLGRKLSDKEVVRELGGTPTELVRRGAAAQARIDAQDAINRELVKDWRKRHPGVGAGVSPKDKKEAKEAVKLLEKLKNNKAYQNMSKFVKKNPYLAAGLGTGAAAAAGYGVYKYNQD